MAFGFQGTRGLSDPDEGRYCEVAREMLASGDLLHPTLEAEPHYTKPPMTYWSIAASLAALGHGEWACRLFQSLAYLATVLLVALSGVALFGRAAGVLAGIVYATMALPFVAANIITTDTLLTLWEALAVYAFLRGRTSPRRVWPALTGLAFGLAFFTKGPPGLLFLPALWIYTRLPVARKQQPTAPLLDRSGLILLLAVGLWWFLFLVVTTKGILSYFLGDEVVGRLAGEHHRNSGLWGAVKVYLPILTLGTLPWSLSWIGAWRRMRARGLMGFAPWRAGRVRPALTLLLLLILVPLAVFVLSRSRLPLYVLPLFIPISLASARALQLAYESLAADLFSFRFRSQAWKILGGWVVVLLCLRLAYAYWPNEADARALHARLPVAQADEVVVTGGVRSVHGLAFYDQRVLRYAGWSEERAEERGWATLDEILTELRKDPTLRYLILVKPQEVEELKVRTSAHGLRIVNTVKGKKITALLCDAALF
jgi:4-amino-4-deoxy-L-arabinose transferase-like glycosyltransferase